jgi:hypothetical protein
MKQQLVQFEVFLVFGCALQGNHKAAAGLVPGDRHIEPQIVAQTQFECEPLIILSCVLGHLSAHQAQALKQELLPSHGHNFASAA